VTQEVTELLQEPDLQRILLVLGESKVGKSTFLENIETKGSGKAKSFGLQYSYNELVYLNQNIVANFYELGGGLKALPLMQLPLNASNISDTSIFLLIDCTSIETAFNHLELWLPQIVQQLEAKAAQLVSEGKKPLVDRLREKRWETLGKEG
jgi:predicted AAA+ superfamily ATPase